MKSFMVLRYATMGWQLWKGFETLEEARAAAGELRRTEAHVKIGQFRGYDTEFGTTAYDDVS